MVMSFLFTFGHGPPSRRVFLSLLAESLEKQQWERHDILDQEERTHPGPGGTFSVSFSHSHTVCALLLFDEGMNLVEDAFYWFVVVVALLL